MESHSPAVLTTIAWRLSSSLYSESYFCLTFQTDASLTGKFPGPWDTHKRICIIKFIYIYNIMQKRK